jgi:hypothetical protein
MININGYFKIGIQRFNRGVQSMGNDYLDQQDKLVITSTYPSTILKDFQIYLNYLNSHKIKLTRANGYFTKKDLQVMYAQMEEGKAKVDPKSTQTGYPILNLFYHLSIELGFIKVIHTPHAAKAMINMERIGQFTALTDTEQYVTLLQAFWTEIDWEVLQGEEWGRVPYIPLLLDELEDVPSEETLELAKYEELYITLREYGQFLHYFSYFGFWRFELDEEKTNRPGRPKTTVARTMTLSGFFKVIEEILLEFHLPCEEEEDMTHGEELVEEESLASLLKPLFPAGELERILK